MRRGFGAIVRVAVAMLLGVGLLVMPGRGTTAVVARSPDCPPPPVTIQKLIRLGVGSGSSDGLACYGGQLLTFRAYVLRPMHGDRGVNATTIAPRWLDGTLGSSVVLGTGPFDPRQPVSIIPWAVAYVPPALGRCSPVENLPTCPFRWYYGRWATVSAHFDGPVARTCRIDQQPRGMRQTRRDAVAYCRAQLIVLSVGSVAPPDTATGAVGREDRPGLPPTLLAVMAVALISLLVAGRRRPRRP